MKIDTLILGSYQTNCYILGAETSANDCLIIDAGLQAEPLIDFLTDRNLNPAAIILTHGHADHIVGLSLLREKFPKIKVYIHKLDAQLLTDPEMNLSLITGVHFQTEPADYLLEENQTFCEAGIELRVIHTPGHTQGGISLYSKDHGVVFVGDTLFAGSIGRTDFPGGNLQRLISSIKDKILILPDQTVVYPGHGPATTIQQEKLYNPYLT